ncbi:MAG: VWA domain-containing protein [Haliea sp.]
MQRLLLVLVFLFTAGQALAAQNLLFIMDASGSMWGRVDGEPKIVLAREVLADLVTSLPDTTNAGLIAYGHNRKGDCEDIETLVPVAPLQREAMIARVGGLNPKGKTPITGAIAEATELLRQIEQTTSVILVSDGLESCGGDPCQAVREARAAGVDFRMHVVGFDLGDTDTAELQCMADAGGGRYFSATNASELSSALEEAVRISPEPEPEPVVEVSGGKLLVTISSNGKPVRARTYLLERDSGEEASRSTTDTAGLASHEVAPGSYRLRVVLDGISAPEQRLDDINIEANETLERTLDIPSGAIKFIITSNGKPIRARTYLLDRDSGEEASRSVTDAAGLASYEVPPGNYRLRMVFDGISAPSQTLEDIVVVPEQTLERRLDIPSGSVELAVTSMGIPVKARTYMEDMATGEELARSRTNARGVAEYTVATGTYQIKIRPDSIEADNRFIRPVEVNAGETLKLSLDFADE